MSPALPRMYRVHCCILQILKEILCCYAASNCSSHARIQKPGIFVTIIRSQLNSRSKSFDSQLQILIIGSIVVHILVPNEKGASQDIVSCYHTGLYTLPIPFSNSPSKLGVRLLDRLFDLMSLDLLWRLFHTFSILLACFQSAPRTVAQRACMKGYKGHGVRYCCSVAIRGQGTFVVMSSECI